MLAILRIINILEIYYMVTVNFLYASRVLCNLLFLLYYESTDLHSYLHGQGRRYSRYGGGTGVKNMRVHSLVTFLDYIWRRVILFVNIIIVCISSF